MSNKAMSALSQILFMTAAKVIINVIQMNEESVLAKLKVDPALRKIIDGVTDYLHRVITGEVNQKSVEEACQMYPLTLEKFKILEHDPFGMVRHRKVFQIIPAGRYVDEFTGDQWEYDDVKSKFVKVK